MYAQIDQVLARAGALAAAFADDAHHPNSDDIEQFLIEECAEIDSALAGRGYAVPATGDAATSLGRVAADGALLLALAGKFPGGETANPAAARLAETTLTRYQAAWEAIRDGTHAALATLHQAQEDTGTVGAADFWSTEPDYGMWGSASVGRAMTESPLLQPYVARGMKF